MANRGRVNLGEFGIFYWTRMEDGEISGHVEDVGRRIISGTSGWYRTNDPDRAAEFAALEVAA